ncbi:cytochrome P450 [Microdochium bolleyi]|uniref:Cytochrome P450 monooxygenase ABA1 n=1 Tax=Microdochium bolleyi TaxID=196109 RepID=A0A136IM02_9PEZI|nr:cytochrome P450 [Microdochium bolleyi]
MMAFSIITDVSRSTWAAVLGTLALAASVWSYARSWYRLRHIPGPPLAPFSYLWLLRNTTLSGRQAATINAINETYGPLARIGPNSVLTNDPEVVRRMNAARSTYVRSDWYRALSMDPYYESLSSIRDTKAHDKMKAKLSFGYGGKENPNIETGVDVQLQALTKFIREKYVSASATGEGLRPMDFASKIQYFTLDAITQVAYGKAFGFLAADADVHEYIESTTAMLPMLHAGADVPWIGNIVFSQRFTSLLGPKATDAKGYGKMIDAANRVVAERFGEKAKDKFDMLGSFVRHGVSQRACESEVQFQIIAGSDTTATALRGTLYSLLTRPAAYATLQREIDAADAAGALSSPVATAEESRKLPYLQAVIYEGLRVHIPFSGLVMKDVPPGGDTLCGFYVPGGTRVATNFLGLQRSKEMFGDDADVFRPERWLDLSPEQTTQWRAHVELVFGNGRWGCSGKTFAFMELEKTYIQLLRNFDFQLIDPSKPMTTSNYGIFVQEGMWLRITDRKS